MQIKEVMKNNRFTKRGLLSYLHTPFDPFGMGAPAMLEGRLLQREVHLKTGEHWDGMIHYRRNYDPSGKI